MTAQPLLRSGVHRVLVVGYGYAGHRYAGVLSHLARATDTLEVAGIVDSAPERLRAAETRFRGFADLDTALQETRADIVVVAVNESAHFEVLQRLQRWPKVGIICEKPLTESLDQAEALRLTDRHLTVNFVERQSPCVAHFRDWLAQRPYLRAKRIEFFWGKDRTADPRPTMGVLSEVTHALDLIDYLFGYRAWALRSVVGVTSDFSPCHDQQLDSLDLVMHMDSVPVIGHSSFSWCRRRRNITAFLADGADDVYRAVFDFDSPRWDCDTLEITRIDTAHGVKHSVFRVAVSNDDFPAELHQVFKVYEFVRKSVASFQGHCQFPELVGYAQAVKMQRLLHDVNLRIAREACHTSWLGLRPVARTVSDANVG